MFNDTEIKQAQEIARLSAEVSALRIALQRANEEAANHDDAAESRLIALRQQAARIIELEELVQTREARIQAALDAVRYGAK